MISRLAGIYDQARDQSGLLDQNAFLEGIARHYSVRTILADRNWTAWLEIPYIQYE